jgi:hypothetical protein
MNIINLYKTFPKTFKDMIEELFDRIDEDEDGIISLEDLKLFFNWLNEMESTEKWKLFTDKNSLTKEDFVQSYLDAIKLANSDLMYED